MNPGNAKARPAAAQAPSKDAAPSRLAWLYSGAALLTLELSLAGPSGRCAGWVILPRAGGASADPALRRALQAAGFGILSLDLLSEIEAASPAAAFNTALLASRLAAATRWLSQQPEARGKRLGYLAGGPASGAALRAAAELGNLVAAVVTLAGRVDLAADCLAAVAAPTLLVVNRRDRLVLAANRDAARRLNSASRLVVAPSFRYLRQSLKDPSVLSALLSVEWLSLHVAGVVPAPSQRPSILSLLGVAPVRGRAAAAATVLALLAALGGPGQPALAAGATITLVGGVLIYTGTSASSNLTVGEIGSPTAYRLSDPNEGSINFPAGCVTVGGAAYTVDCVGVTNLLLNLNDGNDTVTLVVADGFKPTLVSGGPGVDSLTIDDAHTSVNGDALALTDSTYDRTFINTITYGTIDSLQVLAEPANNPISIFSTSVPTTLNAGGGSDDVTIGSASGNLDPINGALTVLGGSGSDGLTINDFAAGLSSTYKSGTAPRSGVAPITFQSGNDFESLVIVAGAGGDTMDASGFNGPATLAGVGGNDLLTGGNGSDILDGGGGNDTVAASSDTNFTLSDTLLASGSIGNDTLAGIDAASLTGGLSGNTLNAFNFTHGQVTMLGGDGSDVLYGSPKDDSLDGGNGSGDFVVAQQSGSGGGTYKISDTLLEGPAGVGLDTLQGFEYVQVVAGGQNDKIDVSTWTQNTYLFGGDGNDTFIAGSGSFQNVDGQGGAANELRDSLGSPSANWVLSNSGLVGGDHDVNITNIQQASLSGSGGADRIDASQFYAGPVSLRGNVGDDTLLGGGGIFGDVLDGGTGTDRVVATADTNMTLSDAVLSFPALGSSDQVPGIDEASLTGGSSSNTINAFLFTRGPVTLVGQDGADTLTGSGQNDSLSGGVGADSLDGGGGNDTISGGPDADNIQGGSGTDRIVETGGSFTLSDSNLTGAAGSDILAGIDEASLTGGSSADSLTAVAFTHGPVTLDGSTGTDTLTGGSSSDMLVGGGGSNDMAALSAATDFSTLNFTLTPTLLQVTNRGSDTLSGIAQASLGGGFSNDTFDASAFTGPVTLLGNGGDDLLRGGSANDSIDGGPAGNDTLAATDLTANNNNMILFATSLVGGAGVGTDLFSNIEFASLVGGDGDNSLDASAFGGSTTLRGGVGKDTLVGSPQDDSLDGGAGNADLASFFAGNANITLTGTSIQGAGNDTLIAIETFLIKGGPGPNIFDASAFGFGVALDGGGGNDLLIGSAFDDTLLGVDGNDTLLGKGGSDSIDGGIGSDMVVDSGDQNFTLTASTLSGNGGAVITGIEQAVLTGGVSSNLFNVTAFTGTVSLFGAEGDDTLILGSGGGSVDGGVGAGDLISMTANANLLLTDATLTGNGSYGLSGIELAGLAGGSGANNLNASGFSSGSTLSGLDGNDTLIGGAGNSSLLGGNNDDSLTGGPGADTLNGGSGNDRWVESGDFSTTLVPLGLPGEQDDSVTAVELASITGGAGDNTINLTGFTGAATVDGAGGNDLLSGGNLSDSINGNGGNDTLVGNAANDTLDGGGGTDLLYGAGDLTFILSDARLDGAGPGGTGTDTLIGIEEAHLVGFGGSSFFDATHFGASQAAGQATLEGGGGNDTLIGGEKNDSLDGGPGSDSLTGGNGNDTLTGGDTDSAAGATSKDTLVGGAGDDLLDGVYGDDSLDGGPGNDQLIGASGSDVMLGGEGNDLLSAAFDDQPGPGGNDTVSGGLGDDTIEGGPGIDLLLETADVNFTYQLGSLLGGLGTDALSGLEQASLTGGDSPNVFNLATFTGTATLRGGLSNDTFTGTANDDSIDGGGGADRLVETAGSFTLNDTHLSGRGSDSLLSIDEASLTGGAGADTLSAAGFSGSVTLDGAAGADSLVGGLGPDSLVGGDNNDTLTGGPGDDQILGGLGSNLLSESAPLTPSVQFTLTNQSLMGLGTDVLSNTLAVSLTGSGQPDVFNTTAFTGAATLLGGAGADTFLAAAGSDSIDGGAEVDRLAISGNFDMRLTGPLAAALLTMGDTVSPLGVDSLTSIEQVSLTGGASGNRLDASDFAGVVTLDGALGDDLLRGGLGADSLQGGVGFDTLTGGPGADFIDGGADLDLLAESGLGQPGVNFILTNNSLTGLGSTDLLFNLEAASLAGSANADTLNASAFTHPATLSSGEGDDSLVGGSAGDSLDGGEGSDTLTGNGGSDTIVGGLGVGTDYLVESGNNNFTLTNAQLIGPFTDFLSGIDRASLTGGLGNNSLDASVFTNGSVTLDGAGGNDALVGTTTGDWLRGGPGNDTLRGGAGPDTLDGGAGDLDRLVEIGDSNFNLLNNSLTVSNSVSIVATDILTSFEEASLTGGLGANIIVADGFTGTVTLLGGNGSDVLVGGPLNDNLLGGAGSDSLTGGPGNDSLAAGPGDIDWLIENADVNFTLSGGQLLGLGADTLDSFERVSLGGGAGDNLLDASAFIGPVVLSGGPGSDTLIGTVGGDTLDGGDQADLLQGGLGDNSLLGGPGNDTLLTSTGSDTLLGGADDDSLTGGGGNDLLDGGAGVDRFAEMGDVSFSLSDSALTGLGTTALAGLESATLTGGPGDNNFDLQGWTQTASIEGGAGADSLTVSGTSGADTPIVTGSQVDFGGVLTEFIDVEHLAILGGAGDDSFSLVVLNAALAQPDAGSALTALTLSGGDGNDIFNLTPEPVLTVFVDGGDQPGGGADQLNLDSQGLYVDQQPGRLTPEGQQPLDYTGIELVNLINYLHRLFISIISR